MIPMYVALHNGISVNIYTCTDGLQNVYFVVSLGKIKHYTICMLKTMRNMAHS